MAKKKARSGSHWTCSSETSLRKGGDIIPFLCTLSASLQGLQMVPKIQRGSDILLHSWVRMKTWLSQMIWERKFKRLIKAFCSDSIVHLLCNMKIKPEPSYFKWIQTFLPKSNRISSKFSIHPKLQSIKTWKCSKNLLKWFSIDHCA